jgi:prolyl oligopeptidase
MFAALAAPLFAAEPAARSATPPVARRVDVVERVFGLEMPDPYRWMESTDRTELLGWLKAHNEHARSRLDAQPGLKNWQATLSRVGNVPKSAYGYRRFGSNLFFTRESGSGMPTLVVRDARGEERVLFDPATAGKGSALLAYVPSTDGTRVVLNVGIDGSESGELRVHDVASGERLGHGLSPVWSESPPSWLADGSGFFYNRMRPDPKGGKPLMAGTEVYLHRIGRPQSEDRRIIGAGDAGRPAIDAHDFPDVWITPGSDWAMLTASGARMAFSICVMPAADIVAATPLPVGQAWRCLVDVADNIQGAMLHGDTLFLRKLTGTPNGSIVSIDLRDPDATLAKARVFVPERKDAVLAGVAGARDGLYLQYLHDGVAELVRIDYASGKSRPVRLPSEGNNIRAIESSIGLDGLVFSSQGWLSQSTYYQYVPSRDEMVVLDKPVPSPIDVSALVLERIQARSADGTLVPLTVIHRRDHVRDGSALAVVTGYGAYGLGMRPRFDPLALAWANAGHVFAICHTRGGDEKGEAWRTGGSGPNKQRGVEDFIACAKTLAERGDTSPRRTGAISGSMGGVLLGGAYVTAPDAFGAMALTAAELDVTRVIHQNNGINQIAELGDPRTEAGMRQLLAMDPYQRVRDGTRYPTLLLSLGLEDERVDLWQSGKMAARVMAASPETLVLIRAQSGVGHFNSSDDSAANERADIYTLFESVLGAP